MTKNKTKNLVFSGLILTLLLIAPHYSSAAGSSAGTYDVNAFQENSGLDAAGKAAGFAIGGNTTPINTIISTVLYSGLSLVGILFFAYLVYGAYIWMTSKGNEEKVKAAATTLTNSIIGLIITLSAYAITYFLINFFWK